MRNLSLWLCNKFDKTKLKILPAGSIYSEVAGQNHFAMTGKDPVIVEITGFGPSGVTYVDLKTTLPISNAFIDSL